MTVIQAIPANLPQLGPAYFRDMYTDRVLHSVTYELAEGYYRMGKFPRAKRWFEFTARTSKRTRPHSLDYLWDLKRPAPYGRVHEVEPRDRELELDF